MRVQFNTGRMYTAAGQIIVAELDGGIIYFNDVSRMVHGKIVLSEDALRMATMGQYDLARVTLACYDNGRYQGSWDRRPQYDAEETVLRYAHS